MPPLPPRDCILNDFLFVPLISSILHYIIIPCHMPFHIICLVVLQILVNNLGPKASYYFFFTCVSPPLSLIQRVGGRLMHFNVEESFVFKVYLEEINICLYLSTYVCTYI